jgi:citrate lyase subunit beta/citryl-CoA lyase
MTAWLFVPGHRSDRFDKALAAGASAVIVDLEDAVAPQDKGAARAALAGWLASTRARVTVRINGADSPWFDHDLAVVSLPAVEAVMVPKAERLDTLARVRGRRPDVALVPMVETAQGVAQARAMAAAPGVARLAFGSIDLQVDLGLRDAHEDDLLAFRTELVLASRLAGIDAPVDGVTVAIDDAARLAEDVQRARRLGFGGKLCIHPRQVSAVRAGFAPSAQEIAWAERVLRAAAGAAGAAVALDGKMVDRPVILRAQAILREAPPS